MRAVLEKLAGLAGITIEICGSWVWVSGDTYPVKDIIKAAGCFFSSKKKMWYWREEKEGWHGRRGGADMATIRLKYGSQSYTGTAQKELANKKVGENAHLFICFVPDQVAAASAPGRIYP